MSRKPAANNKPQPPNRLPPGAANGKPIEVRLTGQEAQAIMGHLNALTSRGVSVEQSAHAASIGNIMLTADRRTNPPKQQIQKPQPSAPTES